MPIPISDNPIFGLADAVQKLPKVAPGSDKKDLEAACRDFESIFVNYMMQKMRDTVPQDHMFGGGQAEKIYTGMLDSEVAKSASQHRGIGLAAIMYAQLSAIGEDEKPEK